MSLPEVDSSPVSLVLTGEAVLGDVDSDGRAEVLTAIICQEDSSIGQVLALKLADDGKLSPLGFVLRSADHKAFEVDAGEPIVVSAGVVTVAVLSPGVPDGGHDILEQQQRGYRYESGTFRQVSGPTKFATPPTDAAKLDVRNATVMLQAGGSADIVKLRDGSGRATLGKVTWEVKVKQAIYAKAKPEWLVLYELKSAQGATEDVVMAYDMDYLRVLADSHYVCLKTGDDGILGINEVEVQGDLYKVTVRTAGGSQPHTYRMATSGAMRWVRA